MIFKSTMVANKILSMFNHNYTIFVNCQKILWNKNTISYEDLQKIHKGFSIMYVHRNGNITTSGTLIKGQSVKILDNMRFDVHNTGNA